MNSLSNAPFVRILPAFCIGIACSFYEIVDERLAIFILIIGICGSLIFSLRKIKNYSTRCYVGASLQFIYFILGFALTEVKDERKSPIYFEKFGSCEKFIATIEDSPKGNDKFLRVGIRIIKALQNDNSYSSIGKCYLYFKDDSSAAQLSPGDEILFCGSIRPIASTLNPGQFDFKHRSSLHRIYCQAYLNPGEWRKLSADELNLKRLSGKLRNRFLNIYREAGITGQEYAVLSALVLGYDDEIDQETMKAFSASGTLHVLSVSGMHVGIIFTALSAMLTFLERKRSTRILRIIILLIALWFYAMLTGLSPSVIRSAMMFSFILIGRSLNRSSNIYNSLALSALCIFVFFDPLMLFEVGLQLSFLAVAGIAFLYPKIYKWFYFDNKLIDKTWALIAVSIAAQAATFALSIYYFHQFPNYFIPANLVIIPISTAGIFGGIIMLFFFPVKFLVVKSGWIVGKLIWLLNASALLVEELPGAVWQNITISIFEMVIIYAILFALIFFLEKRALKFLYSLQIFIIFLFTSFICNNYNKYKNENVLFFSNTSSLCCQFTSGSKSWLLYHSIDSIKAFKFSDSYCASIGITQLNRKVIPLDRKPNTEEIFISNNKILFGKYLIVDLSGIKRSDQPENLNANIIFLKNSSAIKMIDKKSTADEIIINRKYKSDSLDNKYSESRLPIHFLSNGSRLIKL